MKILTVTLPESTDQIHVYAAKIKQSLIEEVETAFEELDIQTEPDIVAEVASELKHGNNYWYDESLCFEIIEVR